MATDPIDGQGNTSEKITFTPEQQAFVNNLLAREKTEAKQSAQTELATTKTALETVQAEFRAAQEALRGATTKGEKKEASEDLEVLRGQLNEAKTVQQRAVEETERIKKVLGEKDKEVLTARQEAVNIRKQVAIQGAASKVNFVDLGVVQKLTQDNVVFDETRSRFVVTNDEGTARMNASFEPMSLEEYYTEYASKNPYLVRGSVLGGASSAESQRAGVSLSGKYAVEMIFGPKSNAALANKLAMENITEYRELRKQAVASGLLK